MEGTPIHPSSSLRRPVTPLPYSEFLWFRVPSAMGLGAGPEGGAAVLELQACEDKGPCGCRLPGAAPRAPLPQPGTKGLEWRILLSASYGNLINLSATAPTGLLCRLFVSCSQLVPRVVVVGGLGGVQWFSSCLAELEGDCSPIHWALTPPRANPQLLQEERTGRTRRGLWRTGRVACLGSCAHLRKLFPQSGQRAAPAQLGPKHPALDTR